MGLEMGKRENELSLAVEVTSSWAITGSETSIQMLECYRIEISYIMTLIFVTLVYCREIRGGDFSEIYEYICFYTCVYRCLVVA